MSRNWENIYTIHYDTPTTELSAEQNNGGFGEGLVYLGKEFVGGVGSVFEGIGNLFDAMEYKDDPARLQYEMSRSELQHWLQNERNKFNPSEGWEFAGGVSAGLGQSAVYMGISAATSFIPGVGPALGKALIFGAATASATGNALAGKIQEGHELNGNLWGYALTVGVTEGGVEVLTNNAGKAASRIVGGAAKQSVKAASGTVLGNFIVRGLARVGYEGGTEGLEEGISYIVDYYAQKWYDINPNARFSFGEMMYNVAVGAVSGAVMSGGSSIISDSRSIAAGHMALKKGTSDNIVRVADNYLTDFTPSKNSNEYLNGLYKTYNRYQALENKTGTEAKLLLGQMKAYNGVIAVSDGVLESKADILFSMNSDPNTTTAQVNALMSTNYTAEEIQNNKDHILEYAASAAFANKFVTPKRIEVALNEASEQAKEHPIAFEGKLPEMNSGDVAYFNLENGDVAYVARSGNSYRVAVSDSSGEYAKHTNFMSKKEALATLKSTVANSKSATESSTKSSTESAADQSKESTKKQPKKTTKKAADKKIDEKADKKSEKSKEKAADVKSDEKSAKKTEEKPKSEKKEKAPAEKAEAKTEAEAEAKKAEKPQDKQPSSASKSKAAYIHDFYAAVRGDNGKPHKALVHEGKRIEYGGYVFYTISKGKKLENAQVTEERTGLNCGEFGKLKEMIDKDPERFRKLVESKPDVNSLPKSTKESVTIRRSLDDDIEARRSLSDSDKSKILDAASGDEAAIQAITESDTELKDLMQTDSELQARKRAANEYYISNEGENTTAKENATEAKNEALAAIEESTDEDVFSEDLTEDVEGTAETVTEETTEEATVDEAIEEETAEEYRDNYTAAEKEFARKLMSRPKNFDLLPYETRKNILDMVRSAKGVDKDSIQYAATLMERRFGLRIEFGNYKNKGLHLQSGNGRRLMLVRSSDANHALIHELWHELYGTEAGQKIVTDLKGSEIVKGYEDDYAKRYKQHTGKEISDELKTEEGIGDLLAEKLNDIRFVKRFARSQRGFFLRSIGFLSDLMADIKNVKNPVYRDARRLERTFIEGIGRYTYEDAYAEEAFRILGAFEEIEAGEGAVTEDGTAEVKYALASPGKKRYNRTGHYSKRYFSFLHKNFPPENEVQSEAHRLAVWWARSQDVQTGDRTLISMNDRWYLVEKFDDAENYYQVEAYVTKREFEAIFKEIKEYGRSGQVKSVSGSTDFIDKLNKSGYSLEGRESSAFGYVTRYGRENNQIQQLGQDETDGRERSASDGTGDRSSSGTDRQWNSVKHSLDSDYLSAVENGDMETAQRMVDEAAKAAGYDSPMLYHGTTSFGFTEFDSARSEDRVSVFATTDEKVAKTYASDSPKTSVSERASITPEGLEASSDEQILSYLNEYFDDGFRMISTERYTKSAKESIGKARERLSAFIDENAERIDGKAKTALQNMVAALDTLSATESYTDFQDAYTAYERATWDLKWADGELLADVRPLIVDDLGRAYTTLVSTLQYGSVAFTDGSRMLSRGQAITELYPKLFSGVYKLFGRTGRSLTVDADGANWNDLDGRSIGRDGTVTTKDVVQYASLKGYDSVVFESVVDRGGTDVSGAGESTVYAFLGENALKSADPVTYDDDGNIIPLSRRFDRTKRDIRYSLDDSALESSLESTGVGAEKGYREGVRGTVNTMMIGARIAFFDAYAGSIDYLVKRGGYTQQEAEVAVQKARMGASRGNGAIESGQLVDGKVEEALISILKPIYEKGDQEKEFFFNYLEHKHNIDRMSLYDKSMEELGKIGKEYRAVRKRILPLRDQIKALEESGNTSEVNELYKKLEKLVKRSIRLKAQMDNFVVEENKPVFGVNENREAAITADESRKIVEKYENEHPEFIEIADKLYKFNDNLMKVRVEAGLITQADADYLKAKYPHYVPTGREDAPQGIAAIRGKNNIEVQTGIKKATGSGRKIRDIGNQIAEHALQVYRAAAVNELLGHLYDVAVKTGDTTYVKVLSEKSVYANEEQQDQFETKQKVERGKAGQITLYRDGKRITVAVSPEILAGFNSTANMSNNAILKLVRKTMSGYKALITSLNPFFGIRNKIRDLQDAGINTRYPAQYLKNLLSFRAEREIAENGKYWIEYRAAGGFNVSAYDAKDINFKDLDIGVTSRGFEWSADKNPFIRYGRRVFQSIEVLNAFIEQSTRLNEYICAREAGASIDEALLASAEVTTNFGRSGNVVKTFNTYLIPFLNPAVQGMSRMYRNVVDTKMTFAEISALLFKLAFFGGFVPQILLELLHQAIGDDEYEELSDTDKTIYYVLPWFGETYLKIPKGRISAMFAGAVVQTHSAIEGEGFDFFEYFENVYQNNLPFDTASRSIISPVKDAWTNTTWYGGQIEGREFENVRPENRYDESTSAIAIGIGKLFNISPKRVHYVLDQYTGVIGDVLLPATSKRAERDPFSANFTIDPVLSNELSTQFYEIYDEVVYRDNEGSETAYYKKKFLGEYKSAISDLYKEIDSIEASNLSDSEKKEKVRILRATINEIYRKALGDYEEFSNTLNEGMLVYGSYATEGVTKENFKKLGLEQGDVGKVAVLFDGQVAVKKDTQAEADSYVETNAKKLAYAETLRRMYGTERAFKALGMEEKAAAIAQYGITYDEYWQAYFGVRYIRGDNKKQQVVKYLKEIGFTTEKIGIVLHFMGYSGYEKYLKKAS